MTKRLWTALLAAALFTSLTRAPAPAADQPPADAAPEGATRTYDVFDFFWYAGDGSDDDGGDGSRKRRSDELLRLIKETVEPGSWEGPNAANKIEERDYRLVVTGTFETHSQLKSILSQLRESTMVQGVSLDCQFILADETFLSEHAPGSLRRKDDGATARSVGLLKAKSIVEVARETTGVVVVPAPPLPLYSVPKSVLIGEDRPIKLPRLRADGSVDDKAGAAEVSRPAGMSLSVQAVAGEKYVTLALKAGSRTIDLAPAPGADAGASFEEIEAVFEDTFAVERTGAFVVRAPLVRAKLAGVRNPGGAGEEVVRQVEPAPAGAQRHLLLVGTVRPMTSAEVTLLAGARVAHLVDDRYRDYDAEDAIAAAQPPPGAPPGVAPQPPAPQPAPQVTRSTRLFDVRGLLFGTERGAERREARAQRMQEILARLKGAIGEDVPLRTGQNWVIVSAMPADYLKVRAVIDELWSDRLLEPEAEAE